MYSTRSFWTNILHSCNSRETAKVITTLSQGTSLPVRLHKPSRRAVSHCSLVIMAKTTVTRGALEWSRNPDSDQEYVTLNNGLQMPLLGLGTAGAEGQECEDAVKSALKLGYKHIDTASNYENEAAVGRGIKVVERKDVFITTKLGNPDHGRVEDAVKESLERLQTDYIDLYLIHWPVPRINPDIKDVWRAMEKLYEKGLVKAIGVSNFATKKLKELQSYAKIQPAVNQVEVHVWHRNNQIVDYSIDTGVFIQAYSPLGGTCFWEKDPPSTDPTVIEIAKKYNKTPRQVLLRWILQRGFCVIPKSVKPDHIEENAGCFGWTLSDEDFKTLSNIKFQVRMLDGSTLGFVEAGPYDSVEDLWDGEP